MKTKPSTSLLSFSALLLLAGSTSVLAASKTNSFIVSANVPAVCNFNSVNDLSFGDYDPNTGTGLSAESTFNIRCTKNTDYTLALDAGGNSDRTMSGSATNTDTLAYELYQDAAHSQVWDATNTVTGTATGFASDITQTVYGNIPSSQDVLPDSYTDTVTITVSY
ncbi:spore coat U domain-containing protein [Sulfurimonas sp. HSL-3221]|uniref:Csu type fimbrial protein n=1 Tax=Sulfurimonadaceae TaxID=2771471 RepID=UPI001E4669EB|nr:spore coat U domain-containing protein [Sulfurimonas sp. HSL-3221]UFS62424.1 spore coat U domain-containing protein [Sulfurimonas sp. HSL-3221]